MGYVDRQVSDGTVVTGMDGGASGHGSKVTYGVSI
jgi:hypothetical protein